MPHPEEQGNWRGGPDVRGIRWRKKGKKLICSSKFLYLFKSSCIVRVKKQSHFCLHVEQINVDCIKHSIIITAHLLIRVHLIRHCYPSLSAISDMGIKCWTCFWVILGAQRATTYTPLNQWGLGFVVKPRARRESVFPGQSPCPRSGFATYLAAHFSEWTIYLNVLLIFIFFNWKNTTAADWQHCAHVVCCCLFFSF